MGGTLLFEIEPGSLPIDLPGDRGVVAILLWQSSGERSPGGSSSSSLDSSWGPGGVSIYE
jgi:hypothetical protein